MKSMKNLLLAVTGLMVVASCSPKQNSARLSYSSGGIRSNNSGGSMAFPAACASNGQSTYGAIYDANYSYDFETRVKNLLSATVNPSEVGSISSSPSAQTGVRFQGAIKLDTSGNVVTSASKISVKVWDSFASTQGLQPITIEINTAVGGSFNKSTGVGYVVFKDSYGEIRLDGTISNQYFQGQVSFKNSVTVVPSAQPAQGNLGQFYIATCGIIQ